MKAAGPQKSLKPLRWSAQLDALSAACLRVTMLAAIAEFERKLIRDRSSAAAVRAKVNGVHFGRKGAGSGRTTRWGFRMTKAENPRPTGRFSGLLQLGYVGYQGAHSLPQERSARAAAKRCLNGAAARNLYRV